MVQYDDTIRHNPNESSTNYLYGTTPPPSPRRRRRRRRKININIITIKITIVVVKNRIIIKKNEEEEEEEIQVSCYFGKGCGDSTCLLFLSCPVQNENQCRPKTIQTRNILIIQHNQSIKIIEELVLVLRVTNILTK